MSAMCKALWVVLVLTGWGAGDIASAATYRVEVAGLHPNDGDWAVLGIAAPDVMTFEFSFDETTPAQTIVRDDATMLSTAYRYAVTEFTGDVGPIEFGNSNPAAGVGDYVVRDGMISRNQLAPDSIYVLLQAPILLAADVQLDRFHLIMSDPGPDVFSGPVPPLDALPGFGFKEGVLSFTTLSDRMRRQVSGRIVTVSEVSDVSAVPLPSGMGLMLGGLAGLGALRRKKRNL